MKTKLRKILAVASVIKWAGPSCVRAEFKQSNESCNISSISTSEAGMFMKTKGYQNTDFAEADNCMKINRIYEKADEYLKTNDLSEKMPPNETTAFQWLCGLKPISRGTLSGFRSDHPAALNDLFVQVLEMPRVVFWVTIGFWT